MKPINNSFPAFPRPQHIQPQKSATAAPGVKKRMSLVLHTSGDRKNAGNHPDISELIESLKSAFRPGKFNEVAEILVFRENELKEENKWLKEMNAIESMEKMQLQSRLEECKNKNRVLEATVDEWRRRFEKLEGKVLRMEEDVDFLQSNNGGGFDCVDDDDDDDDDRKTGEEKCVRKDDVGISGKVGFGVSGSGSRSCSAATGTGGVHLAGDVRTPSQSILEISNCDKDVATKRTLNCKEPGNPRIKVSANFIQSVLGTGTERLKRKRASSLSIDQVGSCDNDEGSQCSSDSSDEFDPSALTDFDFSQFISKNKMGS